MAAVETPDNPSLSSGHAGIHVTNANNHRSRRHLKRKQARVFVLTRHRLAMSRSPVAEHTTSFRLFPGSLHLFLSIKPDRETPIHYLGMAIDHVLVCYHPVGVDTEWSLSCLSSSH